MIENMSNADQPYAWVWVDATYLRELAQRCTGLARECPHMATAHQLEAIGVELMLKAADLDDLQKSDREGRLTKATTRAAAVRPK